MNSLLVLAGPTASGKSTLALEIAAKLTASGRPTEILCADSVTVYRGFNIGAAKPTRADQAAIPHHLLDIVSPGEAFTAADFVRAADPVIQRLFAEGKQPLLVGGTGFYLRALIQGMTDQPEHQSGKEAELKKAAEALLATVGAAEFHRRLLAKDPASARTVHPNDSYRLVRAWTAMTLTGRPWSELNEEAKNRAPRYPSVRAYYLDQTKPVMEKRVRERTAQMLEQGLLAEVEGLLAEGVDPDCKPMQSIGYKECVDWLAAPTTPEALAAAIERSTLQLIKRQRTWFKAEKLIAFEALSPSFSLSDLI